MKKLILLLGVLTGCSFSGEVITTITKGSYKKEWIDTNHDGKTDVIKSYYVCEGRPRRTPSTIYDLRNNTLHIQRHLVTYSRGVNIKILEGDSRC